MKPLFHKVHTKYQSSYSVRHDQLPNFGTIWHYHPELELHHVIKGEGVRLIGDNICNFTSGEIVLLGSNLPHTWRCSEEYFENRQEKEVEAIVIQFLPDCFGRDFLNLPETYLLPKLLDRAKKGMSIVGAARDKVSKLMAQAVEATNLDRIIVLLNILKVLTETEEFEPIASAHAFYQSNDIEVQRLNKICTFTLSNYKRDISLEEIAAQSSLTVTSFCRYFKMMTRKTYYQFLIEIRISHSCRMLVENKDSIEMICYNCGFNNVSNFYRHFKKTTGLTPWEYRKNFEGVSYHKLSL